MKTFSLTFAKSEGNVRFIITAISCVLKLECFIPRCSIKIYYIYLPQETSDHTTCKTSYLHWSNAAKILTERNFIHITTAALPLRLHSSYLPQEREVAGVQPRKLHPKLKRCLNYEIFIYTFIINNSVTSTEKLCSLNYEYALQFSCLHR